MKFVSSSGPTFRLTRRMAALVLIAAVGLASCVEQTRQDAGQAEADPMAGVQSSAESAAGGTAGQPCTDAWRARGHTTQSAAKAFAKDCLARQGVLAQRLTAEEVLAVAKSVIPSDHPLTQTVPSDVGLFCPAYADQGPQGRAEFWQSLLTAMARPESDYNTATTFWEGGNLQQFSIGLLQLSYTDKAGYGCDFDGEVDLADARGNLSCASRIVLRRVQRDGLIGGGAGHVTKGAAAYWSTLRSTSAGRREVINATSALRSCKSP